jgi:histone acetyltransferase 1
MTTMDADAQEAKRRKLEAKMGGAPPPGADAFAKPVLAKPQSASAAPAPPKPTSADDEAANPFVCDANDAVSFKLVRVASDMATAEPFEPEFTHQIFRDDETIFGYRDLRVVVYMQAHLFKTYVEITFSEKIKSALNPADDVLGMLKKHFGEDVFVDADLFKAELEKDASAPVPHGGGETLATWESADGESVDTARAFRLADDDVYPWHARFEPMTLFFIDGASALDSEDEKWALIVVTRESKTDPSSWRVVSFATVYEFYRYPASTRARLSQIVVLPPFQRQGLGGKTLESTRTLATRRGHVDVTVEDPTPQLQRLRDAADVRALSERATIMGAVRACAMRAASLTKDADPASAREALELPAEVAEEATRELKLCAPQTRRCWEALLYMFAKKSGAPDDSPAARAFTELVVRRLTKQHCADARRDAGSKRVFPTEQTLFASGQNEHLASEKGFVMTKAGRGDKGGQAPDMEEDGEEKSDPAEVLAEYFHETMSNLAWLASAVKI